MHPRHVVCRCSLTACACLPTRRKYATGTTLGTFPNTPESTVNDVRNGLACTSSTVPLNTFVSLESRHTHDILSHLINGLALRTHTLSQVIDGASAARRVELSQLPAVGGWLWFKLDNPITWDGNQGIVRWSHQCMHVCMYVCNPLR